MTTSTDASASRPLPGAVLFDCDGTLADSLPLIVASFVEALRAEGHSFTPEQVHAVSGAPFVGMMNALIGPTTPEQLARLGEAYGTAYRARQAEMLKPLPGAVALLEALVAQKVPLALVTNRVEVSAHGALETLGWLPHFAAVIGSNNTKLPKPAPDPALLALERLGIDPNAAIYVGDHEADMQCAVTAGIPVVIGLAIAGNAEALSAAGATHIAGSLAEVEALLLGSEVRA